MTDLLYDAAGVMSFGGAKADVIELAHDADYLIQEGSIAFSFTAADTNGAQGLFSKDAYGYGGGGNHFALFLDGSTLKARFQNGSSEAYVTYSGVVPGQEYEVAVTFGPDGGTLWIDGVAVGSTPLVMDWTLNVEVMQWGGRGWASASGQTGFDAPFEGTISDAQIYAGQLTAEQIADLAGIGPVNQAPTPVDDMVVTAEDTTLVIAVADLLANDSDPDGDTPVFAGIETQPDHGTLAYDASAGTLTYSPAANYFGADSFTIYVADGNGGIVASTVSVDVTPVNDAPTAVDDDGGTVVTGQSIVINLISNDSDVDGDRIAITGVSDGALGTVVDNGDGTVTYIATVGVGADSFTYTIDDGNGGIDTAEVAVTVTGGSALPQTLYNAPAVMSFNGTRAGVIELAHDADYLVRAGTIAFAFNAADTNGAQGLFSKDAYGYGGGGNHFALFLDGSTLKARFQNGSSEAYVTYSGVVPRQEYEVAVTFGPDGGTLWIDGVAVGSTPLVMDWTLNVEVMQWGGRGWASASGQTGFDAPFEGTISDAQIYAGQLTAEQIADLAGIGPVNQAPTPVDDMVATSEDTALVIAVADLLANDTDPDGDTPVFAGIETQPDHGTLAYDASAGTLTYSPAANYFGDDSFTIYVADGNGGIVASTVSVDVTPVNDAPTAVDDEGGTVVTGQSIVINLISNDSDIDGDSIAITGVSDGTLGTVVDNGDGTVTYIATVGVGADSFTYTIGDGDLGATATVTLTVLNELNADPVAANDDYGLDEDGTLTVAAAAGVLANDSDTNADTLGVTLTRDVEHGTLVLNADGSFSYTPDADYNGSDSFDYAVSDGNGGGATATVTLDVAPINDAPLAANDSATAAMDETISIDVLGNDSDVDGDSLTVSVQTGPTNGLASVNADGTIAYTPDAGFTGSDQFTYAVDDGNGGTTTADVTVTVGGTSAGLVSDDFNEAELGTEWTYYGIAGTATTESDGTEAWLQISSPAGTKVDAYNAMTTPRLLQDAADGDFEVAIRFLNEPNQIYQEHGLLILEDDTRWFRFDIAYTPAGLELLVGDVDGDTRGFPYREVINPGDALYLRITRTGSDFTFDYSSDGTNWTTAITLTSDLTPTQIGPFAGSTSLSGTAPGFVSKFDWFESASDPIISEDGSAPVANDDLLSVAQGAALSIVISADLLGNDSDLDGDALMLASFGDPAHGTVEAGAAGELIYTPDAAFSGIDSFTYTVTDGTHVAVATAYVAVEATGNATPVAVADSVDVDENSAQIIDLLGNDTDGDGDTLSVLSLGDGAHGGVMLNGDGTVTYTPDADFTGTDTFSYTVTDGNGGISTADVTVTVNEINNAPVVSDSSFTVDDDATAGAVVGVIPANDPEGQALSFEITSGNDAGIFSVDASGRIMVADAAALAAAGPAAYALEVAVSDGTSSVTSSVGVTVQDGDLLGEVLSVGAMRINGQTTQATILAHDPSFELTSGTLTFEFSAATVSGRHWLMSKDASGFEDGGHIGVLIENGIAKVRFQSTDTTYTLAATSAIAAGDYHHIAVTFGAGGFQLYLDGALQATSTYTGGIATNSEPIVLGANQWASTPGFANQLLEPFSGVITEFGIYDAALSASEIAGLSDAVSAPAAGAPEALIDVLDIRRDAASLINIADLLANDSDPNGDTLSLVSFTQPSVGTITDNGDGTFTFVPPAGYGGLSVFDYTITDGTNVTTGSVALNVVDIATVISSGSADWYKISSSTGALDNPTTREYTAAQLFDANGDGLMDFVIAGRLATPAITLYLQQADGTFAERIIETRQFDIEAGGAVHDIDGDGDLDLVFGGGYQSNEIWWWENPGDYAQGVTWQNHLVKASGGFQQHDMAFGDFDNDGDVELAYWNQRGGGKGIYLAEIPANPSDLWATTRIYEGTISEGMVAGDIDGDGVEDIVVGGAWLKFDGATYTATTIDSSFSTPQTAVGDLNEDGRLDVVISSGDFEGPLMYYTYTGDPTQSGSWVGRDLLGITIDGGHSLEIADIDQDGHLDIFLAEMNLNGTNPDATTWILFGDGTGNFEVTVVDVGTGNHESTLGDLDGDGDLDILGKGFNEQEINIWYNTLNDPVLYAWDRHVIESSRPYRAIFEEAGDIDGDGYVDIITGGWWYKNPGSIDGDWVRNTIGSPMKQMAAVFDFDGDGDLDVLGTQATGSNANSNMAWAENDGFGNFTIHTNVESAVGTFLQGTTVTQFSTGGPLQVVLAWQNGDGGTQVLTVPDNPATDTWQWTKISDFSAGEGVDAGDIDGDGDNDILTGFDWLKNNGDGTFTQVELFEEPALAQPDRVYLVDMDGDGDLDSLVGYGHESSITTLAWYEQGDDPEALWEEHIISNSLAGNPQSVDVYDMDGDGDMDVVAGEHLPTDTGELDLFVFENLNGTGTEWAQYLVYEGDEHHDAAKLADFDNDGDMDIYSIGWTHGRIEIYENLTNGFDDPGTVA